MADVFSKEKRSEIMSKVRSNKNKSTEMKLITIFNELGVKGWRRNYSVKGHPDFVFPKLKVAVFVDGCFWHGHNCRNLSPDDNRSYWAEKILRNKKHDDEITQLFISRGWCVLRIWECELKKKKREALVEKLSILL